jgi:hypothetical protein
MHRAHIGLVKRWNDEQIHQSADPDSFPATGSAPDEGVLETRIAKSSKEVALFLDSLQWCVAGHLHNGSRARRLLLALRWRQAFPMTFV